MDIKDEANYLAISGIQHFCFCKRQWALIHLERQWQENTRTFGGSLMHKNADDPYFTELRGDILISRSMPLISHKLKMQGVADVVEFRRDDGGVSIHGRSGKWLPAPVEYKYGQEKSDASDIAQLTLQAICLEEMFGIEVQKGYIYYGKTRHRVEVEFTEARRAFVRQIIQEMYQYLQQGRTPPAIYKKNCKNCSLYDICVPELSKKKRTLKNYIKRAIEEEV